MQKALSDFETGFLYRDKDWLIEQYWKLDLSLREMEKKACLCPNHGALITHWMDKYNIPRRKNPKLRRAGVKYEFLDDVNWLTMQYWGFNLHSNEMAEIIGVQGNKITTRMKKYGIPMREMSTIDFYHYPDWLVEQHYDNRLSIERIGELADVNAEVIRQLIHDYELPINYFPIKEYQFNIDRHNDHMVALQIYSRGFMKCAICGEEEILCLTIDHIDGGGGKHRKESNYSLLARWLRQNNYPEGFRVLCHNCNRTEYLERLNRAN